MRLISQLSSALTLGLLASLSALPAEAAKCPNVHIVLDRSGSMSTDAPGPRGSTRWSAAKEAVNAVLSSYDGKFPIGMSIFPKYSCDSVLVTEPKYKTKDIIKMAIDAEGPGGSTPSGTAMRDAAQLKSLHDPERKQYIIFITDGGPSCGGEPDSCEGTIGEIAAALKQTPAINTFVVGFGGGLDSSEKDCLTRLAVAGGQPSMSPEKFYKADTPDELNKVLADIIKVVTGGGDVGSMDGICDDSCYSNGCKNQGDICIAGECRANPCKGVVCPQDSYCYTDGISPGVCAKACTKPCPRNTRCNMGSCINDPCPKACRAGEVCDANLKSCVADSLCANLPADKACKGSSACRAGQCVDDPCRFTECPAGTRCIPWEGTCDYKQPADENTNMADGGSGDDGEVGIRHVGCSTIPGGAGAASFGVALLYLLALLLIRRRHEAR